MTESTGNIGSKQEFCQRSKFCANVWAVAPLANDCIMSSTSIRSFRHLKHQNLSTGDDFIHQGSIATARSHIRGVVVPFLATREVVAPLTNDPIMS